MVNLVTLIQHGVTNLQGMKLKSRNDITLLLENSERLLAFANSTHERLLTEKDHRLAEKDFLLAQMDHHRDQLFLTVLVAVVVVVVSLGVASFCISQARAAEKRHLETAIKQCEGTIENCTTRIKELEKELSFAHHQHQHQTSLRNNGSTDLVAAQHVPHQPAYVYSYPGPPPSCYKP